MRSLAVLLFVSAVAMLSLYPRGGHLDQTRGHSSVNGRVTMAQYKHGVLRVIDGAGSASTTQSPYMCLV